MHRLSNSKRKPESLKKLFEGRSPARSFGGAVRAATVCFLAEREMKALPELKGLRFKIKQYKNGALFIKTSSSVAANIIAASSDEIISKVNTKLGSLSIKKLSFRI